MTTMRKRASPVQRALFRVVEGAVRAALHDHPEWSLPDGAVGSISKRVVGQVAADLPRLSGLLARAAPDWSAREEMSAPARLRGGTPAPPRSVRPRQVQRGAAHHAALTSTFKTLHGAFGCWAGEARRSGQIERHAAIVDMLRLVGGHLKAVRPKQRRAIDQNAP